jgi:glycerol-3-phosphate O-acyltransferase
MYMNGQKLVTEYDEVSLTRKEQQNSLEIRQSGAGMIRRFGPLYYLSGVFLLMRRLRMDDRSADNIRRAVEQGPVVYVLYARSKVDWLALNCILNQRRLPLAQLTYGLRSIWFRPVLDAFQQALGSVQRWFGHLKEEEFLRQNLQDDGATVVFLVRRKGMVSSETGVIRQLVEIQQNLQRPIQLLPVAVVWQRKPSKVRSDAARFILGSEDQPGPFLKMFSAANRDHEPIVQVGEAVPLPSALKRYDTQPKDRQTRAVRLLLRRYLYRETHVIRGPRIRPYSWFRRRLVNAPEIKKLIQEEAQLTGKKEEKILREVERNLEHIAARFSFRILRVMAGICRFIWYRIFAGVDIREEDIQRMRDAVRDGTPILAPCHRSHLDYLLISSQCYELGLVLPYIVAGENLSFFPLGYFFRGSGAFFIKRSFNKERIFPVVFARYVRLLIREEIPLEFFLEGGRSRTGKLLPPKLGMLGMVMDAAADMRPERVLSALPIAISYEQIAEEKTYARELSGAKKERESVKGILKATRILKKRFGKVYMRVGEPIKLNEIIASLKVPWQELSPERKREVLQEVAERIMYGIGQNMLILPTGVIAMALLTGHRAGVSLSVVQERSHRYDELLRFCGAMSVDSLSLSGWIIEQALKRFHSEKWIERIEDEKGDIIRVVPEYRITLEYYKNGLIHFLAPMSMVANAILSNDLVCYGDDTLRYFLVQSFVLRYEFPNHPDLDLESVAVLARDSMVFYGALEKDDAGKYLVKDEELLKELAGLTQNFLESYLCTLKGCLALRDRDISQKELPKKLQEYGKARLATGEILRPESLSKVNLSNAIRAFKEEGVLQFRSGGGLEFNRVAWDQYVQDLDLLIKNAT